MIDRQLPEWEDDSMVDLLVGLHSLCTKITSTLPPEEPASPPPAEDPALDALVGLHLWCEKVLQLLPAEEPTAGATPPGWPRDLLR
jgi:hypothetical protein